VQEAEAAALEFAGQPRVGEQRLGVGRHVVEVSQRRLAHGDAAWLEHLADGIDDFEQQAVAVRQ